MRKTVPVTEGFSVQLDIFSPQTVILPSLSVLWFHSSFYLKKFQIPNYAVPMSTSVALCVSSCTMCIIMCVIIMRNQIGTWYVYMVVQSRAVRCHGDTSLIPRPLIVYGNETMW